MPDNDLLSRVAAIMRDYAAQTGLTAGENTPPARYLWTDAFALCNFLGLFEATGDSAYRRLAVQLIDQVHHVLGRHRGDDGRSGWLCGLDGLEAANHPTRGGLRIGKRLKERGPAAPLDERLEWHRDGQYFHYLMKWMHALDRSCRVLGESRYGRWAAELAQTAHARFTYLPDGADSKLIYWKMSIDLSYPLVKYMGHHDPLDGLITYIQLDSNPARTAAGPEWPDLGREIAEMAAVCAGKSWTTDDPLGIGGLLGDALRLARLTVRGDFSGNGLLEDMLEAALQGLKAFLKDQPLKPPADFRLAFRELGLAIGLHAIDRLDRLAIEHRRVLLQTRRIQALMRKLLKYMPLSTEIEDFWLEPLNQSAPTWVEHLDINRVMLATSLAPGGYLKV